MLSVLADVGGLMAGGLEGAWFVITYFPILSYVLLFHELLRCFFFLSFGGWGSGRRLVWNDQ